MVLRALPKRPGQTGDRDAHVGRHHFLAGVKIFYGEGRLVANLPQLLPSLLVLLKLERFASLGLGDLACRRHVALDSGLAAAELQKEGRRDCVLHRRDGAYAEVMEQYKLWEVPKSIVDRMEYMDPLTCDCDKCRPCDMVSWASVAVEAELLRNCFAISSQPPS